MRMKIKDWVYGGPCEVSIWVRLNTGYMPPFLATSIRNMIIFDQLFSHMSDSVPHLQVGLWTHLPSSIYLAQTSTNSAVDLCIVKTKLPTEKCVQNLPKNRGWWRRFARNSSTRHESLPSTKPTTFSNKMAAGGTSILRRVRQKNDALGEVGPYKWALNGMKYLL